MFDRYDDAKDIYDVLYWLSKTDRLSIAASLLKPDDSKGRMIHDSGMFIGDIHTI